nr:AMP-binding protein [Dulcicalothrix desertica]
MAVNDLHAKPKVVLTYTQLNQKVQCFAASLQAFLMGPGDKSALIADNSPRWLIADQGIMMAGAVDAMLTT